MLDLCLIRLRLRIVDLLARLGRLGVLRTGRRQTLHGRLGGLIRDVGIELQHFRVDMTDPLANYRLGDALGQGVGDEAVPEGVDVPRELQSLEDPLEVL